jgi:hypothetical protein
MKRSLLLSLIISLVLVSPICLADPLDQWHWISPLPTGNSLNDVTYGSGTWVAVGQLGTIVTSRDGVEWGSADSGTRQDLNRVTFGNGTFVAVGAAGTILRSADASTWTPCASGTAVSLTGIAFGRGRFAATGDGGKILFSLNGADWKAAASGITRPVSAIVYDGVKFVAYSPCDVSGGFACYDGKILTSTDARSWTLFDAQITGAIDGCFKRMDYGGGKYFMNGGFGEISGGGSGVGCGSGPPLTSSDGISWSPANGVDRSFSVAFGKGVYAGQYGASPDGVNWNPDYSTFGGARIYKIKYAPEAKQFVAVGWEIWSSSNGTKWTKRTRGARTEYGGITFAGNRFVTVGDSGTIRASSDGKTWSNKRVTGTTAGLYGIAFGRHLYVAVGEGGTILTSPNGVTWTPRVSGTTDFLGAVTYGKGKFVAVGQNHVVLSSSDGITWTPQYYNYDSDDGKYLNSVAFGNGRFIAAGYEQGGDTGVFFTSLDGLTWTKRSSLASSRMKVLFANGKFWMICYDGGFGGHQTMRVLTSKSDRNWIQQSTLDSPADISFANGVFFLSRWWGPGSLETSTDTISWTPRETGKDRFNFWGAAFGAGTYVLVGSNGAILQSDPVAPGP